MTPEEIAREAAEALVWVAHRPGSRPDGAPYEMPWVLEPVLPPTARYGREKDALFAAAGVRSRLTAAFLAAIERALREVPVPGGLSDDALAAIRGRVGGGALVAAPHDVRDLLRHLDHLTRVLQDCAADGALGQWLSLIHI